MVVERITSATMASTAAKPLSPERTPGTRQQRRKDSRIRVITRRPRYNLAFPVFVISYKPRPQPGTFGASHFPHLSGRDLSTLTASALLKLTERKRRRRTIAVAASLLAHLALLLLFFCGVGGGAAPESSGGGNDDSNAIVVTLAGRIGAAQVQSAQPASQLDLLFRQLHDEQSPLTADAAKHDPSQSSAQQLLDAVDDQRPTKAANQGSGKAETDRGGTGASLSGSKTEAEKQTKGPPQTSTGAGGSGASAGGGLWGQIKPCWDKLGAATVPVSLEIILDRNGKIATPPRIIRPDGAAPDEKRLISEARALAAVAACVPYHAPASGKAQSGFRVDFVARR